MRHGPYTSVWHARTAAKHMLPVTGAQYAAWMRTMPDEMSDEDFVNAFAKQFGVVFSKDHTPKGEVWYWTNADEVVHEALNPAVSVADIHADLRKQGLARIEPGIISAVLSTLARMGYLIVKA